MYLKSLLQSRVQDFECFKLLFTCMLQFAKKVLLKFIVRCSQIWQRSLFPISYTYYVPHCHYLIWNSIYFICAAIINTESLEFMRNHRFALGKNIARESSPVTDVLCLLVAGFWRICPSQHDINMFHNFIMVSLIVSSFYIFPYFYYKTAEDDIHVALYMYNYNV